MFVELTREWMGQKAGAVIDLADPDAKILTDGGVAKAVASDLLSPLLTKAMGSMFDGMQKAVDAAINKALADLQATKTLPRSQAAAKIFGTEGKGDPDHCFGDWALQVAILGSQKTSPNLKASAAAKLEKDYGSARNEWSGDTQAKLKAALAEGSGVTGGYTVPPQFYDQILAVAAEETTFRQYGWVQPMASATMQFPYLDVTTVQSAGTSPFFGGVVATWTAEAQTRTETEPQFKMMELKAQELSGYTVSSNVLLQDSPYGLEKFLTMLFGRAVGWFEEFAFLQGNGVGKPQGVLAAPATIAVTRNTGGHFVFTDYATMLSKLLPSSWQKCHWYVSPTVTSDLFQMKDGANRAIFLSIDQGVVQRAVWRLNGQPIHLTEKLPALGTKGDVMLVDPSLYVIGDRMHLEIAASEHVNFLKNQMTWRFVQRVDGRPWLDGPITLQDGSTQVSPFVVLN